MFSGQKNPNRPPAALLAQARTIAAPVNYLAGIQIPRLAVPDNIIMFRRDRRGLSLSKVAHVNLEQYVLIVNLRGERDCGSFRLQRAACAAGFSTTVPATLTRVLVSASPRASNQLTPS